MSAKSQEHLPYKLPRTKSSEKLTQKESRRAQSLGLEEPVDEVPLAQRKSLTKKNTVILKKAPSLEALKEEARGGGRPAASRSTGEKSAKDDKSKEDVPAWLSLRLAPPVIVYSIVGGYLIGYLGWSVLWIGVLLYVLSNFTYGEIDRLRKVLRNEAYKENAQVLLSNQAETVEWLNHILERLWIVYSPDLSKDIARSVELVLETSKPAFLESIKLPIFSLGTTGPSFSNAHVYPGLEPDLIHLDLDLTFEPQMADDNQTNGTRIQLVAKMVKLDLPVSVNDIHFKGKLRLQLKLISRHPYVKIVEFCFLQPPELEFVLKPLIPVNVMDVPLFQDFLYNIVQSALSGFVSPSTFTMDIEQMMNPDQTANVSLGVALVTIKQARDLPNMESLGNFFNQDNVSDPFARILLEDGSEVATTKVKEDTLSPIWNESFYVLIPPQNDFITLQILHESTIGKQFIGQYKSKVPIDCEKIEGWFDLYNKTNDKKVKGQVRYEIQFFNRIDESVMEVLESTVKVENEKEKTPILNKGILHFNILEGKDLSMFPGICPMVTGYLNGEEMFTTSSKKNTTKPAWNEFKEIYVDDFENDDIELAVIDNRTGMKLASILFPAIEVKDLGPNASEWHELTTTGVEGMKALKGFNASTPRLRFNASFYPVDIRGSPKRFVPQVPGILEIQLVKGENLKAVNLDGRTSDPFVLVEINNKAVYKSEEYSKNLNPVFKNEPVIGVLLDTKDLDVLSLNISDFNNIGKHKPMGSVFFDLHKLIDVNEETDEVKCLFSKDYLDVIGEVILEGAAQGLIHFKIRFKTISNEKDISLRRRKDGSEVEADGNLGIDAKRLFILTEESNISASKSFLKTATSFINPTNILTQVTSKKSTKPAVSTNEVIDGSASGVLEITLVKATDLLAVNRGENSSDPYVNVELDGGLIYKSRTYMEELNPIFNEDMILHPITLQSIVKSEHIKFRVKDYNKIMSNKLIGEAQLNVTNLLEFVKDSNSTTSGLKFKSPDGIPCVLTNVKTYEGPLTLINEEEFAGKLYIKATMHFKDFDPVVVQAIDEETKVPETDSGTLAIKAIDVLVEAQLTVIQEKLFTIPEYQKNERAKFVLKIKMGQETLYISQNLKEKAHFLKLMPLSPKFYVYEQPDGSRCNLIFSYEDLDGSESLGQAFSVPVDIKQGQYEKKLQLTEWLHVDLKIEGKVFDGLRSRTSSASSMMPDGTIKKRSKGLFSGVFTKKKIRD